MVGGCSEGCSLPQARESAAAGRSRPQQPNHENVGVKCWAIHNSPAPSLNKLAYILFWRSLRDDSNPGLFQAKSLKSPNPLRLLKSPICVLCISILIFLSFPTLLHRHPSSVEHFPGIYLCGARPWRYRGRLERSTSLQYCGICPRWQGVWSQDSWMEAIQESFLGEGMASSGFGEGQRVRHSRLPEACVPGDLE